MIQAIHHASTSSVASATSTLLSIDTAAKRYGVSKQSLRRYCRQGLSHAVSPGGHRRFRPGDIEAFLGLESTAASTKQKILCVTRVSSRGQANTSLPYQRERVLKHCQENYPNAEIEMNERTASGVALDNPLFLSIIEKIINKEVNVIVALYRDRVTRLGISLVQKLCEKYGVAIDFIEQQDVKTDTEEMVLDVVALMTHYGNKQSGAKMAKKMSVKMSEEDILTTYRMLKQGYSYKQIQKHFKDNGIEDPDGKPITASVLCKRMKKEYHKLEAIYGDEDFTTNLEEFIKVKVKKSKNGTIPRETLIRFYRQWCADTNRVAIPALKIGKVLERLGWTITNNNRTSRIVYGGVTLKD